MRKIALMIMIGIFLLGFVSAHGETDVGYDGHHDGGMMSGFYGGMFGMGFFGWIFMILVIVVLVLFIVWLVKQLQERPRRGRK